MGLLATTRLAFKEVGLIENTIRRAFAMLAPDVYEANWKNEQFWSLSVKTTPDQLFSDPSPTAANVPVEFGESQRPSDLIWQWNNSVLEVRTNRWAFTPIYYTSSSSGLFLSTSLEEVAAEADALTLDYAALAVRLRLGLFISEDTPFQEVRVLPPNGRLEWHGGRLNIESEYWVPVETSMSRMAAIDSYIELFRQAVQRRINNGESFVLPLSGGRDSRHILFELFRAGHLPEHCLTTYDYPPHSTLEDVRIAKLLSSRLKLRHEVVAQPRRVLPLEILKNSLTDLGSSEHVWAVLLAKRMAGYASTVWDGIGGDFLSGGAQMNAEDLRLFDAGQYKAIAARMLSRWDNYRGFDEAIERIIQPEIKGKMSLEIALGKLGAALEELSGAPNPLAAFYFWHRARRGISLIPFRLYPQCGIQAVCPYLDEDLYGLLGSLPSSFTLDKQFHTEAIARAFPEFNDIPYEDKEVQYQKWPGYVQRTLADLAFYLGANSTGRILRTNFIAPRMLQNAFSHSASLSNWLAPAAALMLCQIEELVQKADQNRRWG